MAPVELEGESSLVPEPEAASGASGGAWRRGAHMAQCERVSSVGEARAAEGSIESGAWPAGCYMLQDARCWLLRAEMQGSATCCGGTACLL